MNSAIRTRYGIKNKRPIISLAPMAGVTDLPFRAVCEKLGADYSVTEMAASAPQLLNSNKNTSRLQFPPNSKRKIIQIIGNDAKQMARAAHMYAELGVDIIDINLGCPAKKINKKGAGSALLADLPTVKEILERTVAACPLPVTLKTRLGTDHDNYTLFEVAHIATDVGIDVMTVHGRTRACKFSGSAVFDEIANVKEEFPHLTIIANGDITTVARAKQVLRQTQCDGIMIGRGAVGNPWLFDDMRRAFDSTFTPTVINKKAIIIEHIREMHRFYGDIKGVRFARKHIQQYFEHLGLSQEFFRLAKIVDANEQLALLTDILADTNILLSDYNE